MCIRDRFKINVVVDKASTTQAVRAALQAAGLNTNFTASDLRATKAAAIQTKAEASAAAARELARQRAARAAKAELDLSLIHIDVYKRQTEYFLPEEPFLLFVIFQSVRVKQFRIDLVP